MAKLEDINNKIKELEALAQEAQEEGYSTELPCYTVTLSSKNITVKFNLKAYNILLGYGVKSLERYSNGGAKLSYKGARARHYIDMAKLLQFTQVEAHQNNDIATQEQVAQAQAKAWAHRLEQA